MCNFLQSLKGGACAVRDSTSVKTSGVTPSFSKNLNQKPLSVVVFILHLFVTYTTAVQFLLEGKSFVKISISERPYDTWFILSYPHTIKHIAYYVLINCYF